MAKFSNVNQLPATGPLAMYTVKTVLVNAGWTVTRSGDGISLYSSSGDILTTGASGAGGLGNARAYFNVRDASSRVSFSFQMITNTTWRVKYSESSGFTGGTPTFQTVASATDEQVLYGAGTDASPTGTQMLHTDDTYRFHVVAQSTAQTTNNTYPFWFGCTLKTTGVRHSLFLLEGLAPNTYHPSDQAPRVITTWYTATALDINSDGFVTSSTDTTLFTRGWVLYNLGGAAFRRFSTIHLSYSTFGFPVTGNFRSSGLGTSPYDVTQDQPLPVIIGRITNNGAHSGLKGFCSDVKYITSSTTREYPDTILNATNAYVAYEGLFLQWPESVAPLL